MKKSSKILLALGSVASMSAIPLVAASCKDKKITEVIEKTALGEISTKGDDITTEELSAVIKAQNPKVKEVKLTITLGTGDKKNKEATVTAEGYKNSVTVTFTTKKQTSTDKKKLSEVITVKNLDKIKTKADDISADEIKKAIIAKNPAAKDLELTIVPGKDDKKNKEATVTAKDHEGQVVVTFTTEKEVAPNPKKLSEVITVKNLDKIRTKADDISADEIKKAIIAKNPAAKDLELTITLGTGDKKNKEATVTAKDHEGQVVVTFTTEKEVAPNPKKLSEVITVKNLDKIRTKADDISADEIKKAIIAKNPAAKDLELTITLGTGDKKNKEATVTAKDHEGQVVVTFTTEKEVAPAA